MNRTKQAIECVITDGSSVNWHITHCVQIIWCFHKYRILDVGLYEEIKFITHGQMNYIIAETGHFIDYCIHSVANLLTKEIWPPFPDNVFLKLSAAIDMANDNILIQWLSINIHLDGSALLRLHSYLFSLGCEITCNSFSSCHRICAISSGFLKYPSM